MRLIRSRRGYIGPIGDDFPSIFPLLLGLLIFFSALYVAYLSYQSKNDAVQCMRANLMMSRAVRYQVYFDDRYWDYACHLGLALRGNYRVNLIMWIEYKDSGKWVLAGLCPSRDSDFWNPFGPPEDTKALQVIISKITMNKQSATMTYPVLWKSGVNKQARLVVVTWR